MRKLSFVFAVNLSILTLFSSSSAQQTVPEWEDPRVFAVNKEPLNKDNLVKRLKEIYDPRPDKLIFVKGDPKVKYEDVIWAMDVSRGAGVKVIGVPPVRGTETKTRPTTGQDAELAAIQRILIGEQYMTVYKAIKPEAEQAAELAVNLVNGDRAAADALAKDKVNNDQKDVPSIILTPVAVTKANAKETVGKMVADGFLKADQICAGPAASACQQVGIA